MKRNVQVLLVLMLGAALLHISLLTDLYLRYVKEGLRPLLIVSGVLLVVLGLLGALSDEFPFNRGDDDDSAANTHHGHDHGSVPKVAWILYLPALMLLFVAPPALGSYTVSQGTEKAPVEQSLFKELPSTDPLPLSLTDFNSRAVWDSGRSLQGRTVELTGFVTPGADGGWNLSRLVVSCCAADAQALNVAMHGADPRPADTWITVTGVWRKADVPALDVRTVEDAVEPKNPYQDVP